MLVLSSSVMKFRWSFTAGWAAEQVVYGNVTTGAESDLEKVTQIARQMVGRWGMNDRIGLVTVLPATEDDGPFGSRRLVSEHTMEIIDDEVRKLVEHCDEIGDNLE